MTDDLHRSPYSWTLDELDLLDDIVSILPIDPLVVTWCASSIPSVHMLEKRGDLYVYGLHKQADEVKLIKARIGEEEGFPDERFDVLPERDFAQAGKEWAREPVDLLLLDDLDIQSPRKIIDGWRDKMHSGGIVVLHGISFAGRKSSLEIAWLRRKCEIIEGRDTLLALRVNV
jgi:hypothetical protein